MLEKIGRMFGGQGIQSNPQWYCGGGSGVGVCFGGWVSSTEWSCKVILLFAHTLL